VIVFEPDKICVPINEVEPVTFIEPVTTTGAFISINDDETANND